METKLNKIPLANHEYYFFKYIQKESCLDLDKACSILQLAILKGNLDYIEDLLKKFKLKDLMQLAVFSLQI